MRISVRMEPPVDEPRDCKHMINAALPVALALAASPQQGNAETITAKTLFEWCTSEPRSLGDALCTMYISGFVHGAKLAVGADRSGLLCLPAAFTGVEGREVFVRVMRTVEVLSNERPDTALAAALSVEFGCDRTPK